MFAHTPKRIFQCRPLITAARRRKPPPSAETLAKVREMVGEDQLLFDHASRVIDEPYREVSGAPRGA